MNYRVLKKQPIGDNGFERNFSPLNQKEVIKPSEYITRQNLHAVTYVLLKPSGLN